MHWACRVAAGRQLLETTLRFYLCQRSPARPPFDASCARRVLEAGRSGHGRFSLPSPVTRQVVVAWTAAMFSHTQENQWWHCSQRRQLGRHTRTTQQARRSNKTHTLLHHARYASPSHHFRLYHLFATALSGRTRVDPPGLRRDPKPQNKRPSEHRSCSRLHHTRSTSPCPVPKGGSGDRYTSWRCCQRPWPLAAALARILITDLR